MTLVVPFTSEETPELVQVGGKAWSLIFMTQHGMRVPPGFVLTVAFFQPWLDQIQATPEWAQALSSTPVDLEKHCEAVKALCLDLELDAARQEALRLLAGQNHQTSACVPRQPLPGLPHPWDPTNPEGPKRSTLQDVRMGDRVGRPRLPHVAIASARSPAQQTKARRSGRSLLKQRPDAPWNRSTKVRVRPDTDSTSRYRLVRL